MEEPTNIGKTTSIVNQGKEFVIKTRYVLTRKTRARNRIIYFLEYGLLSVKRNQMIQVDFFVTYQ